MNRDELIAAQQQAASALAAGAEMAAMAAKRLGRGGDASEGAKLGKLLANPAEFWATASAAQVVSQEGTRDAIALEIKLASARLAVNDLGFARETLLGQACWLGVVASRLANRANKEFSGKGPGSHERAMGLMRLALKAQQQSGQAVASAAALNKLVGENVAATVVVG